MQYGSLVVQHTDTSVITVITSLSYPNHWRLSTIPLDSQRTWRGHLKCILLLWWHRRSSEILQVVVRQLQGIQCYLVIYLMYEVLWVNSSLPPHTTSAAQPVLQRRDNPSKPELKPPWPTVGSCGLTPAPRSAQQSLTSQSAWLGSAHRQQIELPDLQPSQVIAWIAWLGPSAGMFWTPWIVACQGKCLYMYIHLRCCCYTALLEHRPVVLALLLPSAQPAVAATRDDGAHPVCPSLKSCSHQGCG